MAQALERLDGRGNNKAIEQQVKVLEQKIKDLTPDLKPTVGPTLYEQEKASKEDEWETEEE